MVINYIKLAMIELEKENYENYQFYMFMNRNKRVRKQNFANKNFEEDECDNRDPNIFPCMNDNDKKIKHWSECEWEYLESNHLIKSDKEISEKLNRPINGVKWQRRKLGLSKPMNWKK